MGMGREAGHLAVRQRSGVGVEGSWGQKHQQGPLPISYRMGGGVGEGGGWGDGGKCFYSSFSKCTRKRC